LIRTIYESEIRRLHQQNLEGVIAEYDCIANSLALLAAEEDGTPMVLIIGVIAEHISLSKHVTIFWLPE